MDERIAFLNTEFATTGLLTKQQLMDAIAVGQFTPGSVFSSVTLIGYQINGLSGAIAATVAIFLPSFLFVALLQPLMKRMRHSATFASFLGAVNVASVAIIIASICFTMGKESIAEWHTIIMAAFSSIVVFKYKTVNSAFIVIGGALLEPV